MTSRATDSPRPADARSSDPLSRHAAALIDWFGGFDSVAVAFSGGVDSSVVLAAAMRSSSRSVLAVTARSPSVAAWQLELAESIAGQLGASHRVIDTGEVEREAYKVNDAQRCFHCKSTLYGTLQQLCERQAIDGTTLVSGTNADDLGDYRPGIVAGDLAGVRKPLAELGITKAMVREIACEFGLSNAELPASPCLASRIAYGVEVTPERLRRVEDAEDFLRTLGLGNVRVRLHESELARIEVPIEELAALTCESVRSALASRLVELGFRYITLDLQGFASGSMNRPLVSLACPETPQQASRSNLGETT